MEDFSKELNKIKRRRKIAKINVWVLLVIFCCVFMAVFMFVFIKTGVFHSWLMIVYIVCAMLVVPGFMLFCSVTDKKAKKLCDKIREQGYSAQELMDLYTEYDLPQLYDAAVSKRLDELGEYFLPEWFCRGCYGERLPEREDFANDSAE